MYLICNNGYLRWPQSICPYMAPTVASAEGYFSSNLESVRKNVECTFGILKKRWKILNNGLLYQDKKICEIFFVTAVCLRNMLVEDTIVNYKDAWVGRGSPLLTKECISADILCHQILVRKISILRKSLGKDD